MTVHRIPTVGFVGGSMGGASVTWAKEHFGKPCWDPLATTAASAKRAADVGHDCANATQSWLA